MTAALFALLLAAPNIEFFEKSVRPVLAARCQSCHGAKAQMAGLNLATGAGLEALKARIVPAISYAEKVKMPPGGKLPEAEISALKSWVEMGAPWPQGPAAAVRVDRKTDHWAFQPVRDHAPPAVRNRAWARSPIDLFILARLEENGLQPAAPAGKLELLRRVTLDLTGLPPSLEEIAKFERDGSLEKVVDRLLETQAYGERWGRHWLDVARYADSTGMDEDHIYPHAWRFRDYVVDAFRRDLPFDRFIAEQLAGDLLPEANVVATGFLALGPKPLAQQDRIKMIYDVVDEQIDTVSKAFLGLTITCARCHDHKFDPIPTRDYYGLASIFAGTTSFRNLGRPGAVSYLYYAPLDHAAWGRYQAHRWRMYGKQLELEEAIAEDAARENALLRPRIAALLTSAWKARRTGAQAEWLRWLEKHAAEPFLKKWAEASEANIEEIAREYQDAYLKSGARWDEQLTGWRRRFATEVAAGRDLPERPKFDAAANPFFAAVTFEGGPMQLPDSPRVTQLRREFEELKASLPEEPPMASGVKDGPVVEQRIFLRGDNNSPGDPVAKHFPEVLGGPPARIERGSGRLELARWLASPDNPLTARVIVNRVWQWHFGEGLVRTPNNWGVTGEPPTHPEPLDLLTRRFIESGWSIKALHRIILNSATYRMSARGDRQADPGNRLWSRFNRLRMSVEQIRDSLLALDGSLDLTIGGSLLPAGKGRPKIDFDQITRRTLYLPVRRGSIPTLLATFDYGDATTSSDGRPRTNVAPQALFMRNSAFVVARAAGFAKRLLAAPDITDQQRIERAYLAVLTRRPTSGETDEGLSYIEALRSRLNDRNTAWASFCHVLMSTNEFLYLN